MKIKTEDIKYMKKSVSEVSLQNRMRQVEKIGMRERNKGMVAELLFDRALQSIQVRSAQDIIGGKAVTELESAPQSTEKFQDTSFLTSKIFKLKTSLIISHFDFIHTLA